MARKGNRPTLRDVASAAGVSLQTVSNVLNNPERVAPATRERVTADIARLGFRPNVAARSLRKRRADALGIQIPAVGARGFGTIHDAFLSALTVAAQEDNAHLIPFVTEGSRSIDEYEQLVAAGTVDGFVLTDTHPGDPRPEWLRERDIPFVSFGRIWDDPAITDWVDVDGAAGTAAAVAHLADAGYARVGFLGWPEGSATGDDRLRGWQRGCADVGLEQGPVVRVTQDVAAARRGASELLAQLEAGDAIVCVSDTVALGVLLELDKHGWRSGDDIGVVGFDDTELSSVFGLSTIRQPVGRIAAHVLSRLRGEQPRSTGTLITPRLVARRSTTR